MRRRLLQRLGLTAVFAVLLLAVGTALVSGALHTPVALSSDVADLRARHGRLAGRIAAMPAFDPSVRDLVGLAAEARTLVAPLERLEHGDAASAANHARALASLAGRAARSDDVQSARLTVNELRQAEAALSATLAAIQRDVERTRGRRAWLAGGALAGVVLLTAFTLLAYAFLRGRLARALASLADVVERMEPSAVTALPAPDRRSGVGRTEGQRVSGRLRHYEWALETARDRVVAALALRQSLIDSLPAAVALLDAEGRILHVNGEWRRFARANHYADPRAGIGANYLAVCDAADGDGAEDAKAVAAALRAILRGQRQSLKLEYPCHAPNRLRWYRMMARRVSTGRREARDAAAVVMHVDVTERKLAEQKLTRVAYVDPLTGLPTRAGLTQRLEEDLHGLSRTAIRYLAVLDLQNLHGVNETYGYEAGDELLAAVAGQLGEALSVTERIGRVGGDQFALLIDPGAHGLDPAVGGQAVADWINGLLAEPFRITGRMVDVGVWIGVAQMGLAVTATDLLRRAALAAHIARERPDTNWIAYNRELDERVHASARITRALDASLAHGELELHYQPAVSLADGGVLSAEALLRWRDPERGLQPPGVFMPIAETSRLVVPIGEWVIREACRTLRAWRDEGLASQVAVNVSRVQFAHADVADCVEAALDEHGVAPDSLWLEVTESAFEQNTGRLLDQMERLHALGVRLALDDFGTGYSSLNYLQQFPFDVIKIDQRFTRGIEAESYSREVVRMVRALAEALDARVIAEGVESRRQRDRLMELGCDYGQGFYYSMPLTSEDYRWLLASGARLPVHRPVEEILGGQREWAP